MVSVHDLVSERLVLLTHHSLQRRRIEDWFARRRLIPNVVAETPQSTIACALVAAGAGVAIVSRVAAASWSFAPSTLAIRRLKERVTTDVALVFPVIGTRSKLVESYAREMRAEIRRLLPGTDRCSVTARAARMLRCRKPARIRGGTKRAAPCRRKGTAVKTSNFDRPETASVCRNPRTTRDGAWA